jgi:hypothetical protein
MRSGYMKFLFLLLLTRFPEQSNDPKYVEASRTRQVYMLLGSSD